MKNKKTLLICLCAALAVGTAVGTTVAVTQCEKEPNKEQQPSGVAFNGTYYADVNGSELLFTLQDNAFTWVAGSE